MLLLSAAAWEEHQSGWTFRGGMPATGMVGPTTTRRTDRLEVAAGVQEKLPAMTSRCHHYLGHRGLGGRGRCGLGAGVSGYVPRWDMPRLFGSPVWGLLVRARTDL